MFMYNSFVYWLYIYGCVILHPIALTGLAKTQDLSMTAHARGQLHRGSAPRKDGKHKGWTGGSEWNSQLPSASDSVSFLLVIFLICKEELLLGSVGLRFKLFH